MKAAIFAPLLFLALAACTPPTQTASVAPSAAVPEAKDGWREYPLREGVVAIQPAKWKTETIEIYVPPRREIEYKLSMKKGETVVYSIAYEGLAKPEDLVVEFHGHTEQVNGVGDLMYYSKTGGVTEHGSFTAPWDGIHGWYLKNDGETGVKAKLDVAGYYTLQE